MKRLRPKIIQFVQGHTTRFKLPVCLFFAMWPCLIYLTCLFHLLTIFTRVPSSLSPLCLHINHGTSPLDHSLYQFLTPWFCYSSILPTDFSQAFHSKMQMWSYDSPSLKSFNDSPWRTVLKMSHVILTHLATFFMVPPAGTNCSSHSLKLPRTCASLFWEALFLHCTWKLGSQFLEFYMSHLLSEALLDQSLSSVWWVLPLPFLSSSWLSPLYLFCSFLHSSVLSHQIP